MCSDLINKAEIVARMFFKRAIHFCSYHLQESTFRTLETTRGKALAASSQGDTQSKWSVIFYHN